MEIDENRAVKLSVEGKRYFFCSRSCLEKFAAEHGIPKAVLKTRAVDLNSRFFKNKNFIVSGILLVLAGLSFYVPVLLPFRNSLWMYFKKVWWAVLSGLFLGGIIDYYVPRKYISSILAGPKKRTIFYSVLLGFLMSACSHGILALSIELHKKGASNSAVAAFLLASPWANLTFTVMMIGFFGLKAFFIIFSALFVAVNTGLIFQVFERKGIIEKNENAVVVEKDFSMSSDIRSRFASYKFSFSVFKSDIRGVYRGFASLSDMVLWWVLIGVGIAGFLGAYVPPQIFQNYMGPSIGGLLTVLLMAVIIEVCSEGSAPIAFEIFRQTKALGNSFVFLMAGVVTDYTEIGLLWHNVGKRTAVCLPIVAVPQVILLGLLANIIF